MNRPLPWLLLIGLACMWLLLNNTLSGAQALLGCAVSALMVLGYRAVRPAQPRLRRPMSALRLFGRVCVDVLRSNLGVARVVLGLTGGREVHSGFVDIPLDVRDPHALATLAVIVTSTPGTIWVDLSTDGRVLTLHVLDLRDPQGWIDTIKGRYERLLMEIFE